MIEVRTEGAKGISAAWMRRIIAAAIKSGKSTSSVSVLLTGERQIRHLNKLHLRHDYATDVISFGSDEPGFLGDLVVSVDTARRMAEELGISFREELARYLVHGTLHLLGYDDK